MRMSQYGGQWEFYRWCDAWKILCDWMKFCFSKVNIFLIFIVFKKSWCKYLWKLFTNILKDFSNQNFFFHFFLFISTLVIPKKSFWSLWRKLLTDNKKIGNGLFIQNLYWNWQIIKIITDSKIDVINFIIQNDGNKLLI